MIRNVLKIKFSHLPCRKFHPLRNSIMKYSIQPTSQKSMSITNNLSFALLNFIYVVHAQEKTNKKENSSKERIESVIKEADELYKMGKFQESFNVLEPFKASNEVEIIWRFARVMHSLSKVKGIPKDKSRNFVLEAYAQIQRALALNNEHFAVHKWMAILHDAKCTFDGPKARLAALPVFKEHLSKAIELNPKDATSIYMLGQYMYSLADMSWFQKKIAATLFGKAPEGSFEEAFQYFSKAEEVEPNFYSANLLMLGKTCLKLKKLEAARFWLKCASAYPVRTDEDEAVRIEAENLLKDYILRANMTKQEEKEENIS